MHATNSPCDPQSAHHVTPNHHDGIIPRPISSYAFPLIGMLCECPKVNIPLVEATLLYRAIPWCEFSIDKCQSPISEVYWSKRCGVRFCQERHIPEPRYWSVAEHVAYPRLLVLHLYAYIACGAIAMI